MKDEKLEYDVQKRAKAGTAATFRAVVAVYVIYLGYQLIRGILDGSSDMAPALGWGAGLFFIAAGLAFGYYAWRRWHQDVEAARLPQEQLESPENPED